MLWALILCMLNGLPAIAYSASVINVDLIAPDTAPAKPGSAEEKSDVASYLLEIQKITKPDKDNSLSAQQRYSGIYRIIDDNQIITTDFLNRSGLLNTSPFEEEIQENLGNYDDVLDDIKVSLKDLNSQWNSVENSLTYLLENAGINSSTTLISDQADLLAYTSQQRPSLEAQIDNWADIQASHGLLLEPALEDQSFFYQLLFFISVPHLLQLLSDNLFGLLAVAFVLLIIKSIIQFVRWKMKRKKMRRIRKNRSIDGIRKF